MKKIIISTLIGITIIQFSTAMEGEVKNNLLSTSADWTHIPPDEDTNFPNITRHGDDNNDLSPHQEYPTIQNRDEPENAQFNPDRTVQDALLGVDRTNKSNNFNERYQAFVENITKSSWYQSKPIRYSFYAGTGTVTVCGCVAAWLYLKK